MAKLRHVAISVPDVEKASAFYQKAFGMTKVGETHGPIADGHYLSDGTVNLAILHFKMERAVGEGKGLDWYGLHHIGFWVDDVEDQRNRIEKAGGKWFMGEVKGAGFYEVKFTDPFGNMVDISHHGWGGAVKDGPAPAAPARRKRVTKARKVIAAKTGPGKTAAKGRAAAAAATPKRAR